MFNSTFVTNKKLCQQIDSLVTGSPGFGRLGERPARQVQELSGPADVVITPNEMNDKHGTGSLVRRIFRGCDNILSIRSRNDYGGEHDFGRANLCLSLPVRTRSEMFQYVLYSLEGVQVKRITCVPYLAQDLLISIAIRQIYDAPLCVYLMDDQNICVPHIPDALMREFLNNCSLRLTTHPEMRSAYESKYGLKFWLLPAVVPEELIWRAPPAQPTATSTRSGALVGSIWSAKWFARLQRTLKGSGQRICWYGNNQPSYFTIAASELLEAGIEACGIIPEDQLAASLRSHLYAVVPTGIPEEDSGNDAALARLSLPGRILFILATSNTPVIVLGGSQTPAARFVERFGIGLAAAYSAESFRKAVEEISSQETQSRMRRNAAKIADALSSEGIGDWLWQSLEKGEPVDDRFERLMRRSEDEIVAFIEPPVPADIYREYMPIYQVLRRLREKGLRPDFVIDVGASTGIWSNAVGRLFPGARFVLVDPLSSHYDGNARRYLLKDIAKADIVEAALSDHRGRASLQVPPDLYGASLLNPADFRTYKSVEVKVMMLDELAADLGIKGRGILKVDVQCAEHLVLAGGPNLLQNVDVLILELSLPRFHESAKTFAEMQPLVEALGFRYCDDAGCWRSPVDGTLLQKDVVFVRSDLYKPPLGDAAKAERP